jgi:sortase B
MRKSINHLIILFSFFLIISVFIYYFNEIKAIKTYNVSSSIIYDDVPKNNVNEDIIGSINIIGLNISLPLVQGLDNEYYLNHDYNKNLNKFGAIFLDYQSDLNREDTSIIYGHSSKIYNLPFNGLVKYLDNNYLKDNNLIRVNYLGIDYDYKVISAYSASALKKINKKGYYLVLQTCNQEHNGYFIYVICQKLFK